MTTIATRNEPAVRDAALDIPNDQIVATVVALGHPQQQVTKLRRNAVADFTSVDTFDGGPLTST
jgi:hypothetical protein